LKTLTDSAAMRRESRRAREAGARIGLVPTMGYLHEGHLSLVRRSRAECGFTIASLFVNPAQFSAGEDLERYPRNPERDMRLLASEGVDVVFTPEARAVYREGHSTWIDVEGPSAGLCGSFRPGHFRGVATIVAKLFNIVRPDVAYFGQKDAQQCAVVRRMAEDLDTGVDIVVCPTVREPDGLALSSRNFFLSAPERAAAPALYAALREAAGSIEAGERSAKAIAAALRDRLAATPFRIQYAEAVRARDLQSVETIEDETLIAVAAHLGATRLIDNITVRPPAGGGPGAHRSRPTESGKRTN